MPICLKIPFVFQKFSGCAVWPFIVVKSEKLKQDRVFVNHERIHLRQQAELLVIPFYVWYAAEYVYFRIQGYDAFKAYRAIRFEREAYTNEENLDYLKSRKFWAFKNY